jgi:hypothetical protein
VDDDLERALRDVVAKQAIHDALLRYCRGIDRGDDALVLSAFHADAVDDHTGEAAPVAERVPRVLAKARRDGRTTSHHLGNVLIAVDGEVATSESYLVAHHRLVHDGRELDWVLGARYLDRFERREGAWRIAHRTVVYDWDRFDEVPPRPDGLDAATFAADAHHGVRSADDVSYRLLGDLPC